MKPPTTVRVHYNLHRGDFSVVVNGRVIDHVATITLRDVEFRVSEKGRQRVILSGRRSVHAYAVGTRAEPAKGVCLLPVTYNPYRAGHFHVKGQPDQAVRRADVVTFADRFAWVNCNAVLGWR